MPKPPAVVITTKLGDRFHTSFDCTSLGFAKDFELTPRGEIGDDLKRCRMCRNRFGVDDELKQGGAAHGETTIGEAYE